MANDTGLIKYDKNEMADGAVRSKKESYKSKKHKLAHKMKKVHSSREHCRHCGVETSRSTRYESGHREYDHEKHDHPLKSL